jgi:hypothetical protein
VRVPALALWTRSASRGNAPQPLNAAPLPTESRGVRYFSIVQRKVLTPAAAHDLPQLGTRILGFEARYRAHPRPFAWRFTRPDFRRRLTELAG